MLRAAFRWLHLEQRLDVRHAVPVEATPHENCAVCLLGAGRHRHVDPGTLLVVGMERDGDRIYADRHTRTGSIGVLTIKPSLEGWFEKHRVRQDEFERGRYMRAHSIGRDWDREAQAAADAAIRDYYHGLFAKVADGRGLAWAQVDAVAQGRVWMGEDALRHRLVDEIGGLDDAVAEARRRAGIPAGEKIRLLELRRPRPWLLERLAGSALATVWTRSFHVPDANALYYLADDEIGY